MLNQTVPFDIEEFAKGKTFAVDGTGRMYTYEQHDVETNDLYVRQVNSSYPVARNLDGTFFGANTPTANDLVALVPKT
ncbi:hypothetical protein BMF22_09195 [Pasteurella multocida]|nr:hypothetical protein BMF22_09195 [Pasteurella multocida]